jgi:hypothetical protein
MVLPSGEENKSSRKRCSGLSCRKSTFEIQIWQIREKDDSVCVCVCDRIFYGEDGLAIQNIIFWLVPRF